MIYFTPCAIKVTRSVDPRVLQKLIPTLRKEIEIMRNSHPNVCSLLGTSFFFFFFFFSFFFFLFSFFLFLFSFFLPFFSLSFFFFSFLPFFSRSFFSSSSSPLGICRNGNQLYICMELMSGNLEKYLKVHSDLSPMKRIGIVSQIARGLNWLHNLKVSFLFFSFLFFFFFFFFFLLFCFFDLLSFLRFFSSASHSSLGFEVGKCSP